MAKKITCKFHVQLHFWPFNLLFCKFNIFSRIFYTCFYLVCEQTQIVRLFLILIRGIQCRSVLEKETWERTNEGTNNWIKHTIFNTVLFIAKIERLQQIYQLFKRDYYLRFGSYWLVVYFNVKMNSYWKSKIKNFVNLI